VDITTSAKARPAEVTRAKAIAQEWGFRYVERSTFSADTVALVVTGQGLEMRFHGVMRRWHPGMLHTLRESGWIHPLAKLSGLAVGDAVLDCTCGLGTDATFLSELTEHTVVALESVPALGLMAREGLARTGARVEVEIGDATDWLRAVPADSFDVVVADPMFPVEGSAKGIGHSLEVMRALGDARPLGLDWRDEALRVARKAVVMRDAKGSGRLEALECSEIYDRTRRAARYGVWRLG